VAARLVTLAALAALTPLAAGAQTYQRLHVRSFTLTSSTQYPQLEAPFDVTLTIRLGERVTHVDNVLLPSFSGVEELGDVRSVQADRNGTTYRETLHLVAHGSGTIAIGSAYLDAIDARDGKPKRFISNGLTLSVAPPSAFNWAAVALALRWLIGAAIVAALILLLRKRRPRMPAAEPEPEPAAAPPQNEPPVSPLQLAMDRVFRERDRASVLHLRAELWKALGAQEGQTLSDVLRLPSAGNAHTRALLLAVERASFVDDDRLQKAIEEIAV